MSYDAVETGLLTVIRLIEDPGYTDRNSSQGDYRILAKGNIKSVILHPGSIPAREVVAARRRISTNWEILIELFIPYTGENTTSARRIREERQQLLDHIDQYPTLNGVAGVVYAFIEAGREPEIWAGESSNWWKQVLIMRVLENVNIAIREAS